MHGSLGRKPEIDVADSFGVALYKLVECINTAASTTMVALISRDSRSTSNLECLKFLDLQIR
jgi:hypothetical protein